MSLAVECQRSKVVPFDLDALIERSRESYSAQVTGTKRSVICPEEANGKWYQLSEGLRTNAPVNKKIYTLAMCTEFFLTYRLPDFVNIGFVRLANAFRTESNDLRYHIARVFVECRELWSLVSNVNEICRMFCSVMSSNDPLARSMTLIIIGTMSEMKKDLIAIKQALLHTLTTYLDMSECQVSFTNASLEYRTVLLACESFSATSREFSGWMLDTLVDSDRRVKLGVSDTWRLLKSMSIDADLSVKFFDVWSATIANSDKSEMTRCVQVLWKAALRSVHLQSLMVQYLLDMPFTDPNRLQISYLDGLLALVKHSLVVACRPDLVKFCIDLMASSRLLHVRRRCIAIVNRMVIKMDFRMESIGEYGISLSQCMFDKDVYVCLLSIDLMFSVMERCRSRADSLWLRRNETDSGMVNLAIASAADMLIKTTPSRASNVELVKLNQMMTRLLTKMVIKATIKSDWLVSALRDWISKMKEINDELALLVLESFICALRQHRQVKSNANCEPLKRSVLPLVASLAVELAMPSKHQRALAIWADINNLHVPGLDARPFATSPVELYRLGRHALCLGAFVTAIDVFSLLSRSQATLHYRSMFAYFRSVASAELSLGQAQRRKAERMDCLTRALAAYAVAQWQGNLSNLWGKTVEWQKRYIEWRRLFIGIAIGIYEAARKSMGSSDDFDNTLLLSDTFTAINQLKCRYQSLIQPMFDADQKSIDTIKGLLTHLNHIDGMINGQLQMSASSDDANPDLYKEVVRRDVQGQNEFRKRLEGFASYLEKEVLSPLPIPRFAFQAAQITRMQVQVDPQMRSISCPAVIERAHPLALSIEGFFTHIRHGNASVNRVSKVRLKVYVTSGRHDETPGPSSQTAFHKQSRLKDLFVAMFPTAPSSQRETPNVEIDSPIQAGRNYFDCSVLIPSEHFERTRHVESGKAHHDDSNGGDAEMDVDDAASGSDLFRIRMSVDYEDQLQREWVDQHSLETFVTIM